MTSKIFSAQISHRLKELRKNRGWSLDTTARKTGVSKAMLGQIERGESSPTIGTLWKIASGLETSFSSFFIAHLENNEKTTPFPNDPNMQMHTIFPYSSDTRMEVFEVTLTNNHEQQSSPHQVGVIEHFIVLEGELEVFFDGSWHRLPKGGTARFHADQPHAYRAIGKRAVFQNIINYP